MTSGWQGASYFMRYGLELVLKPAISLKKSWGGYRRTTLEEARGRRARHDESLCEGNAWLFFIPRDIDRVQTQATVGGSPFGPFISVARGHSRE